jgi:hypothetical protein
MKKQQSLHIFLIFALLFSVAVSAQKKKNTSVTENEIYYSENYKSPKKIDFVFSGNLEYRDYFFSDLEEKIKLKFSKEYIQISIRYSNKLTHYISIGKTDDNTMVFHLNIDNPKTLSERNGYDRVVKFDFSGELFQANSNITEMIFKSYVICKHDITTENDAIVLYLLSKINKE